MVISATSQTFDRRCVQALDSHAYPEHVWCAVNFATLATVDVHFAISGQLPNANKKRQEHPSHLSSVVRERNSPQVVFQLADGRPSVDLFMACSHGEVVRVKDAAVGVNVLIPPSCRLHNTHMSECGLPQGGWYDHPNFFNGGSSTRFWDVFLSMPCRRPTKSVILSFYPQKHSDIV